MNSWFGRMGGFILALMCCAAAPLAAQTPESELPSGSLEKILAGEAFGSERETWAVRTKKDIDNAQDNLLPADWIEFFSKAAAHLVRVLAIAAAVVLIIAAIIRVRKRDLFSLRKKTGQISAAVEEREPAKTFLRQAKDSWQAGKLREAWTACYNCALAAYAESGYPFPGGATEYECLRIVRARDEGGDGFNNIVENRVNSAYRGIEPAENELEQSVLFCERLITKQDSK